MTIKVYYHIYTTQNVSVNQFLIDDQLKHLQHTGLADAAEVYCTISGYSPFPALDLVTRNKSWIKCLEWQEGDPNWEYEGMTLKYLYQDAQPEDRIYYMHTKGISFLSGHRLWGDDKKPFGARNIKALNSWRLVMENELIDPWQWRINQLDQGADTVGCYYLGDPFPHYMGNFWWARGSHIRKLPEPRTFDIIPYANMVHTETSPLRIRYEQWLFRSESSYYLSVKDWPWHGNEGREPGYSPGVNPYEDDFALL